LTEPAVFTGTYSDELRDVIVGMRALQDAEPDYLTAHDYFSGDVPEFFASPALARRVGKTGTSFRVNVAPKAVKAVTDRMEVGSVSIPDNEALTKILQAEVWDANELTLELPEWLERMGEYGDAYAFVWPNDDEDGVDIHFSSALTTRAIYDPENPRKIKFVIKWWTEGAGERKIQRVNLYYFGTRREPGRIERWATREGTNGSEATHWTPWAGTEDDPVEPVTENPYGQIVFHFRTARPYGIPLHYGAYGAQDALNKIVVSLMTTMDYQIVPQRALLTESEADDDDDLDDFDDDDPLDPTATAEGKDNQSGLKTGPGELWILKNAKSLVQLPPADPQNFLSPADFFLRMMATATDIPLHFYDPGGDQPSGDSRRQAEGTLTKKVDRLEDSVEATLSGLLAAAMRILGYSEGTRVEVSWNPAQIVDDAEGWTTAKSKIDAGVPVGQVLQEMGYDAAEVATWLNDNDEQDLRRRVQLLGELAKAVRDLSTGVGSGVLPPEFVQAMLSGIIAPEGADDGGQ